MENFFLDTEKINKVLEDYRKGDPYIYYSFCYNMFFHLIYLIERPRIIHFHIRNRKIPFSVKDVQYLCLFYRDCFIYGLKDVIHRLFSDSRFKFTVDPYSLYWPIKPLFNVPSNPYEIFFLYNDLFNLISIVIQFRMELARCKNEGKDPEVNITVGPFFLIDSNINVRRLVKLVSNAETDTVPLENIPIHYIQL